VPLIPSPPAHRLVDLVTHLATLPGRSFTATDLARDVGLNRATCQSILLALEERGWVVRRAGGYALGPALVPVGEAALAGLSVVDEARAALHDLAATLRLEALASVVAADEIIIVAHAHSGTVLSSVARVGQTLPFVPPLGIAHLMTADERAIDAWLDRARSPLTRQERAAHRAAVARARRRGVVDTLDAESRRRFEAVVAELAAHPASSAARRRRDALLAAIAHEPDVRAPVEHAVEVSQISAPVYGPDGKVAVAIGVHGFPHQVEPTRIAEYESAVRAAAERTTQRIGGRPPAGTSAEHDAQPQP
jgi:DNA-binding IclR family transcriptional regulator